MRSAIIRLTILGLVIACHSPKPPPVSGSADSARSAASHQQQTGRGESTYDSVSLSNARINGIGLDMTEPQVRAVAGPPLRIGDPAFSEMVSDTIVDWQYSGLTASFYGHKIQQVTCVEKCITPSLIQIGDTKAKVVTVYGRGFRGYDPSGDALLYAIDHADCWLEFDFTNALVSGIAIRCDYS